MCVLCFLFLSFFFLYDGSFYRFGEQEQLNLVIKYGAEDLFREELEDEQEDNEAGAGGDAEKV